MSKKPSSQRASREETQREQADQAQRGPETLMAPTISAPRRPISSSDDTGGGVSEGTLEDASGSETGGGSDTPTHVEEGTEAALQKQPPLHQGTDAYTGGGSDNGSNL